MEERVIFLIRILVRILLLDWFDWNNYKISSDRLQKKKKKKKKIWLSWVMAFWYPRIMTGYCQVYLPLSGKNADLMHPQNGSPALSNTSEQHIV